MDGNNGGWVKGFGEEFSNLTDARCWETFSPGELDRERHDYFKHYAGIYYNSGFIFGQGTEHIMAMAKRHSVPGRWFDLGAGTSTLFWAISMAEMNSVFCCDLVPEALAVLDEFKSSGLLPKCYVEAARFLDVDIAVLQRMRERSWKYYQFSTMQEWPNLIPGHFDQITAYANFGLAKTRASYADCFRFAATRLRPGGRFLGADWIRSPSFISEEGHDNSYLSTTLTAHAAEAAGLNVIENESYEIAGDDLYTHVISWVLEKPVGRLISLTTYK